MYERYLITQNQKSGGKSIFSKKLSFQGAFYGPKDAF
jgi:hypothetical protein